MPDLADRTHTGIANDLADIARNWDDTPIEQLLARLVVLVPEASLRINTLVHQADDRRTWPTTWWPENGSGAERIIAERHRVLLDEQITAEDDDKHDRGQLAAAAIEYTARAFALASLTETEAEILAARDDLDVDHAAGPSPLWPFPLDRWKPSDDPIRMLEKAGELIAAEIDRLRRAGIGTGRTEATS